MASFLELVANDYGFDDLTLFDMTSLDPSHDYSSSNQPARYIIVATGKSEKHIMKAAGELRSHIKHSFNHLPLIEGMVTGGSSPRARRRMLRRSRKGPMATDNDYGRLANSWVMCETGVDGIFVHLLTGDRRAELNLESLWCAEEDLWRYQQQQPAYDDSDHIFSGVRHFHTSTRFRMAAKEPLQILMGASSAVSSSEIQRLLDDFDTRGKPASKFDFYRTVHILDPSIVSLDTLTNILITSTIPKIEATVAFMKVLMDSPELSGEKTTKDMNEQVDKRLNLLLKFVADLYRYSDEQLNLNGHPEFIPLLWGLTTVVISSPIGSRAVDEAIHLGTQPTSEHHNGKPSIHIASNRNRDIHDLITAFNEANSLAPTVSFRELVLYSYGNAGKWDKFWSTFDISFNILQDQEHQNMNKWLRLAVYLNLRNDPAAISTFFNLYWSRSFPSLTTDLELKNFDAEQLRVFRMTVKSLLEKVDSATFLEVQNTIDSL